MNRVGVITLSFCLLMTETLFAKETPKSQSSTVTIGPVSRFQSKNDSDSNIYVYPITVKGVDCVVVSGGGELDMTGGHGSSTNVAVTCDWGHNPNKVNK